MWYESMEAQRRFFQLLCEWWMPDCRWADRLCEPPPFGISSIRSGERSIPVVESVVDRTPLTTGALTTLGTLREVHAWHPLSV